MSGFEGYTIDYYESIYGELPLGFNRRSINEMIKDYNECKTWKEVIDLAKVFLSLDIYNKKWDLGTSGNLSSKKYTTHYREVHLELFKVISAGIKDDNDRRPFAKATSILLYELIDYAKESEMARKLTSNLRYGNFSIEERIDILKLALSIKNYSPRDQILRYIYFETLENSRLIRGYCQPIYPLMYEDSEILKEIDHLTKLSENVKMGNRIYNVFKSGYKKVRPQVSETLDLNISPEKLSLFYKALVKDLKVDSSYSKESDFIAVFSRQKIPEDYQKIHWVNKIELATLIGECIESKNKWKKAKELFTVTGKIEGLASAYNKARNSSSHKIRMNYFDDYFK